MVPSKPRARSPVRRAGAVLPLAILLAMSSTGCSLRTLTVNALADSLAASGEAFASDADPELVRDALPFALKTIESLIAEQPRHEGLLLSAASGFTQYAYAFLETDAELIAQDDFQKARELRRRAVGLYLRGRDYGLRGLELRHPGIGERLRREPRVAAGLLRKEDVPLLYWTAAAWGAAISAGRDRPELVADLPAVQALMARGLVLEESFEQGAFHTAHIAMAALPVFLGGPSPEQAEEHFRRAIELSEGLQAGPYVTYAESVALPAQERRRFEEALERALAIDPDSAPSWRLANIITQRRARSLLDRADDLFYGNDHEPAEERPE